MCAAREAGSLIATGSVVVSSEVAAIEDIAMKTVLMLAAAAAFLLPVGAALPSLGANNPCYSCDANLPSRLGGGGGGDGHQSETGEPFNPFDEGYLRDQFAKRHPDGDPKLPGYVAGREVCNSDVGDLARVRASAITRVKAGVTVVEICTHRNLMEQQEGMASIRGAINDNAAMRTALRAGGGYSANDVVGVILDGRGARLYVHHDSAGGDAASSASTGGKL
jgi:hypothetical protein